MTLGSTSLEMSLPISVRGVIALIVEPVTAYFDASYNQPREGSTELPVHTVGVYLATQGGWRKFRKEWKRKLDKTGLDYFHKTDFDYAYNLAKNSRRIPESHAYAGWKEEDFEPFLRGLYRIISRKTRKGEPRLTGMACTVVKDHFDAARPGELEKDSHCASYYIFNVVTLMRGVERWANFHKIDKPIHYIFAGGDKQGNNIENLFSDLWKYPHLVRGHRLGKGYSRMGYDIQWMKAEPALQAADVVAGELSKNVLNWIDKGYPAHIPHTEGPNSLAILSEMMTHRGWSYRKQECEAQFAERIKELKANENRKDA